MTDRKQTPAPPAPPEAVRLPGRHEVPDLTVGNVDERDEQAVTMLDYETAPVVTHSLVDERAKPSRGAS